MKTTASKRGIATSIEKNGVKYLISTIFRPEVGCFQTAILKFPGSTMLYRIERRDIRTAVSEHIDTVRMVVAKTPDQWAGTKLDQDNIMNEALLLGNPYPIKQEVAWADPSIVQMLANLNYVKGSRLPFYIFLMGVSGILFLIYKFIVAFIL